MIKNKRFKFFSALVLAILSGIGCGYGAALADTGEVIVQVRENDEYVVEAVVTGTCLDEGCEAVYTLREFYPGYYSYIAMRAPHNYLLHAEKDGKSAAEFRFVRTGVNVPDSILQLKGVPEWGVPK